MLLTAAPDRGDPPVSLAQFGGDPIPGEKVSTTEARRTRRERKMDREVFLRVLRAFCGKIPSVESLLLGQASDTFTQHRDSRGG